MALIRSPTSVVRKKKVKGEARWKKEALKRNKNWKNDAKIIILYFRKAV